MVVEKLHVPGIARESREQVVGKIGALTAVPRATATATAVSCAGASVTASRIDS
jgi:hypothetical protein